MKTICLEKVVKEIFGEQDILVLHLVVLEMGFADIELHPPAGSGGVPGDAPCLKRAGPPCGGGPTMENINFG
ncbi:hypothetical protein IGI04_014761 [Brassica rapa subsp. trilocularis]|uniref:Uncharacterized protein n=1 Tax=Brassica rapa subsp. trilocularis TaxID=1813537 RepID=A0ABQ7MRJ6_BRACM|nr:hypothetical protein IGI04_014761 [Brassica rapa subsp. trilocularis]